MKKIPSRNDIHPSDKWKLEPLFETDLAWDDLYGETEAMLSGYSIHPGRLAESAAALREAVEFDLDFSRRLDRLYTYAHLRNDEDKQDQKYSAMIQRAINLYTRGSEASSFMVPEIQQIPDDRAAAFMNDPALEQYRFYLEKILRQKPHTLSKEVEEVLSMTGELAHAPSAIFGELDNADMRFGSLSNGQGEEAELSHANFIVFLMNSSREVRKNAFHQYYRAYESHKNTIAATLSASVKKDALFSRVRKHESTLGAALFSDNVPAEVYESLIKAVKKNTPKIVRYLELRKKILGLDELRVYDTYVSLVPDVKIDMPYDEAVDICCAALAPLGDEYVSLLREGLTGGWVDRYENTGKRSGAYSSGCYDSPPYILMNYRSDSLNSIYTLIHEAGHSMHSLYANRTQPFVYSGYSIFVAEVASTFNEVLLDMHLAERYSSDPKMTAYIINREIDDIRATLIRQTMFAEFELLIHAEAEANRPVTLETITTVYRGLLENYFGGALTIDEQLCLEALRIPHFYNSFYVYKYATGISAAIALADKVTRGGSEDRDAYLSFLKTGSSRWPLDQLAAAGVDMRKPEPVDAALERFGMLVEKLEGLLT